MSKFYKFLISLSARVKSFSNTFFAVYVYMGLSGWRWDTRQNINYKRRKYFIKNVILIQNVKH